MLILIIISIFLIVTGSLLFKSNKDDDRGFGVLAIITSLLIIMTIILF